jgi:HSP20 family protein
MQASCRAKVPTSRDLGPCHPDRYPRQAGSQTPGQAETAEATIREVVQMSTLVRHPNSPATEFFQWLDLNRPSSLSDLMHFVPVESYTENGTFVVRTDLPGVDPDKDIEVKVDGDVLTIQGERREEEHDNTHSEVRYGSFTRSMRLPKGVDASNVTARYDAGVLVVSMPMTETLAQPIKVVVGPDRPR